jgi:uncharacterized alkaline shock family protein YloU
MNIKLQTTTGGELSIEESAVRSVVELAIKETGEGAARVNRRFLLGSAIRVKEGQDKKLVVDLELTVPYGIFLPDAMRDVQTAVKDALAKNIGIENAIVNIAVTKVEVVAEGGDKPS